MWHVKITTLPVVIGTLGLVAQTAPNYRIYIYIYIYYIGFTYLRLLGEIGMDRINNSKMQNIILITIIIIINPRDQEILGWCPAGHTLISWGKGSSLALVGNPSRDGVSIKILLWRHLKLSPQFL